MPTGIIKNTQYRLSRVCSGGIQLQTYNRIIVFNKYPTTGGAYFLEGFNASEFIIESWRGTWQFRKQTLTPQMVFNFDIFRTIGNKINIPIIRSRLSINPAPFGLKVNKESNVFSCNFQDIDASWGNEINAYNATSQGTNTNIKFYNRDICSINNQRNILEERALISPTPIPEGITEKILEGM